VSKDLKIIVDATPEIVAKSVFDFTYQLDNPDNIQKYVLDTNGNPIGFIYGFYEKPDRALLRTIYVLPSERRKGAATKLIKAFEKEVVKNGITEIKLASNVDSLFRKLGYQIDTFRIPGVNTYYFTKTLKKVM